MIVTATSNSGKLNVTPNENQNCRLRYGLNEDCLLKIFEYVRPYDLVQLCKMDNLFKELIVNWTLKEKVLQLGKLYSPVTNKRNRKTVEIFETIGIWIRKFEISTCDIMPLFALMMKYCKPATLTDVKISRLDRKGEMGEMTDDQKSLLSVGIPQLFTNLRKFCLYDRNKRRLLMLYLLPLLTFAQNIESLELTCRNIFGERRLENLRKLRKLRIHYRDDWTFEKFSGLIDCLETNPELKVFEFNHANVNISKIGKILSKSCQMLERFEDRDLGNIYDRFGKSLHNRYSFLSSFQHLSYVALTSYTFCGSDLYYPLKVMDGRNIVRLKILMSYQPPIVLQERKTDKILRRRVPKFPSLQSVEMEIFDQDVVIYEPESTQCDIRCKFLFHFLAQQKNVQHFEFVGGSLNNMHKILDVVPNIRTLDVSGTAVLFEESREMVPKIVQTLRTYRQSKNNQKLPLLRLILSYDFIIPANNDYGDCVRISFESKV